MSNYVKLFGSMLDSTVWDLPNHTRIVWITLLAMKDQDGEIEASIPGLAKRARVTLEEVQDALAALMAPDKFSRTTDHDGRRIEEIPGGWRVLNHDVYRDKLDAEERRTKEADRKARYRARKAGTNGTRPAMSRDVPLSDTDPNTDTDSTGSPGAIAPAPHENGTPGTPDPKPPAAKKPSTAKSLLPEDWKPTPGAAVHAEAKAAGLDLPRELGRFRDYAKGRAWRMVDWEATWRNWLRRAIDDLGKRGGRSPPERDHFAAADRVFAEASRREREQKP